MEHESLLIPAGEEYVVGNLFVIFLTFEHVLEVHHVTGHVQLVESKEATTQCRCGRLASEGRSYQVLIEVDRNFSLSRHRTNFKCDFRVVWRYWIKLHDCELFFKAVKCCVDFLYRCNALCPLIVKWSGVDAVRDLEDFSIKLVSACVLILNHRNKVVKDSYKWVRDLKNLFDFLFWRDKIACFLLDLNLRGKYSGRVLDEGDRELLKS